MTNTGPGMRRLKRLGRLLAGPAGRGPAAALAVIAALAAFLATAGPRASAALQDAALRKTLAANSATGVGLYANAEWDMTGTTPTDLLSSQEMQRAGQVLSSFLVAPLKPERGTPAWSGLTTAALRGHQPRAARLPERAAADRAWLPQRAGGQRPAGRRVLPGQRHRDRRA